MKKYNYLIVILSIVVIACDTLKGHRGINDSENASHTKGVYLKSYSIINLSSQNRLSKNDSVWIEKDWYYGGICEKDRTGNYFRLIIKLSNPINYDTSWCVGIKNKELFENNGNLIHYLFTKMPKDTFEIMLYGKKNEIITDSSKVVLYPRE